MSPVDVQLHHEVLTFYAQQMRLLDALDLEGYAATFTPDGVTDHAHRGERLEGRDAMLAAARRALPRYRDVVVRHWNDHLLVSHDGPDRLLASYCSLVTRTDTDGTVTFESSFFVSDVLVRDGEGALRTASRTIHRDRPTALDLAS
ncbi:nuclear transport factor 2 family protein [Actinomycetospora sp. NBRC 106378]|jgi:actinorhodin biosynthesis protein ActVIA|uniref:nuclear transport factor 2 family protein n=1 Tax=Actinomycetospora sp. NBRC 106378 TaxID=3032208 RepID=UPI0024A53D8B|nr:nuclear transport factor 2 family protein [Actinomycetospora sp. NBRC 106378]GLZ55377.1 hypothetical protein Acsp07_49940 [Actinomycetospora sp. NBRC 106378]